jgi:DNA-binding CsgD family transcriptional regulator
MSDSGPPLGRDRELAAVTGAVDAAAAGSGSVTLLYGPAGIGKTTLVDAAAAHATTAGVPVLRAAALEMENMRPFAVVADALAASGDGARRRVAELLAGGPPVGPAESEEWSALQFRVGEALLTLLEELSGSGPALLITEDLHWADPASLRVLARLLHAANSNSLAILGTLRPLPRRAELTTLLTAAARAGARRIDLQPLPKSACEQLAMRMLVAPPGPLLRRWLAGAGGNPLLLTELLTVLRSDGLAVVDGHVEVPAGRRPPSLALAVLGHLSVLGPGTVQLLKIAAVLGASFTVGDLARLTRRPAADLWSALSEALTADVLTDAGDRLAFRHDLIHQSVYDDLPAAVRQALHSDAAAALEDAGESPSVVAQHVLRSADAHGPDAVSRLRRAATDALAAGAPGVACELLHAAMTAPLDPELRAEIRAELGTSLAAAGRPGEAEKLLRSVVALVRDPDRRAAALDGLLQALMLQGKLPEAFAAAQATAEDTELPERWRARFAARASMGPLWAGDAAAAAAAASAAEDAAVRAADRPAQVRAILTTAHAALLRGQLDRAREFAATAAELAEVDGTAAAFAAMPHHVAAIAFTDSGLLADARTAAEAARRSSERFGSADGLVCALLVDGVALFWSGQWDDAAAAHRAAVSLAEESGTAWQTEALCMLVLISCWRGQSDAAELLERAEAAAASGGLYRPSWLAWARAAVLEAAGDRALTVHALLPPWRRLVSAGAAAELRILGPYLASAASATGQSAVAAEVAGDLERAASTAAGDGGGLVIAATRARGVAGADPDLLTGVLERVRAHPRPHETARCAEETAATLAVAGRMDEAREAAGQAMRLYGQLGADGELARARATLRSAGLRLGARGMRGRPASGWAALTPTEAEVAQLVAARLSNPEIAQRLFLSRRTVGHHVSRVLAKLGMTSRLEVAAAADRGSLKQL